MTAARAFRAAAAVLLALRAGPAMGAEDPAWAVLAGSGHRVRAAAVVFDGLPHISTTDLSAALGATKRWTPQNRRLELRFTAGGAEHSLAFFAGAPTVAVDQGAANLVGPARLVGGELYVPLPGLGDAITAAVPGGARWDRRWQVLHLGAPGAILSEVGTEVVDRRTIVTLRAGPRPDVSAAGQAVDLLFADAVPSADLDAPEPAGAVERVVLSNDPGGLGVRLDAPGAAGYRVEGEEGAWRAVFTTDSLDVAGGQYTPMGVAPVAGRLPGLLEEDRFRKYDRVVVDVAHGGWDRGAKGDLIESDIVLEIAKHLRDVLEDEHDLDVVFTRRDDGGIESDRRAGIVNASGADICVSLHADGAFSGRASGARVVVYGGADPAPVAETTIGGRRIELLPWEGVQTRHLGASAALARYVAREIGAPVLTRPLLSLSSVDMPAVAVECGFVTSAVDAARLASDEARAEIARGIARGIAAFAARARDEGGF
jgi:N-acetylmuramoyl-L-alanine amidase